MAFGTFWAVEGLGITWPGADLAIIALAAWYILTAAAYISRLRRHARQLSGGHAGQLRRLVGCAGIHAAMSGYQDRALRGRRRGDTLTGRGNRADRHRWR